MFCRSWCRAHYERWSRHGDPLEGLLTVEERFWAKVDKGGPDECWLWTSALTTQGHGVFSLNSKTVSAHRLSYEWLVGPIPVGLEVDHRCHSNDPTCMGGVSCRHRRCVNPRHLEPVTHLVNVRRGSKTRQTHCKHGHERTQANTIIDRVGYRLCRICRDRRNAARYRSGTVAA